MQNHIQDMGQYYTAAQAAKALSVTSGRTISAAYVRQLARYGKLHAVKVNDTLNLYPKYEVDTYRVEGRGEKSARAAKAKAKKQAAS
jgi:hypothetical protein